MRYFLSFLSVFVLVFCSNSASAFASARIEKPENIVRSLYRDFDWEIKYDNSSKELLVDQSVTVLKHYFTPKLAKLIAKDREYEIKNREIGHLDFVLLCGSQDPDGITNLRIAVRSGTSVVSVLYDQNGQKDVMEIDFYTVHTQNGWRISDIRYQARKSNAFPDPGPALSLLNLLSQPY